MAALDRAAAATVVAGVSGSVAPARAASRDFQAAYLRLVEAGLLDERIEAIAAHYDQCGLCPHQCGVNRNDRETGLCGASARAQVYSHAPHFGEEIPLVGRRGSGTIFFSHCNLRCVFCQNWPVAHAGRGRAASDRQLADRMIDLQRRGCHNINFVTPTHVLPNIAWALGIAVRRGLRLPLVYNTSGYERVEMIRLLDGIIDIYLPDLKFMDGSQSERPAMAQAAILEMHRQVGKLVTDERGNALRGLMIRHLVMPNRVAGTREFVAWVAENLPLDTYVNIMPQWRVEHRAFEHEDIARGITVGEFLEAMDWARKAGLSNLDERAVSAEKVYRQRLGS